MTHNAKRLGLVFQVCATLMILVGLSAPVQAETLVRTRSYTYTTVGQLLTETIEPTDPNVCLQTTYGYDTWGNRKLVSSVPCTGDTATARSSATSARASTAGFGTNGLFPITSTNALKQSETKAYDRRFGTLSSLTGPNNLTTGWRYDGFGRKTLETRADGTTTSWVYKRCTDADASCPTSVAGASPVWVLIEQSYAANASGGTSAAPSAPEKRQYFDALNRVIRVQTQGFDGGAGAPIVVQDTQYNAVGQVAQKSNPYSLVDTPVWTTYAYDALGRLSTESHPDTNLPNGVATTTYSYNGLSTTVTNAKSQAKTTTKNALGQVASVTDALGGVLAYTYDAVGNLTATDAAGSVTSMQYDARERKTAMQDPSMGSWLYGYNAFGELVSQRDSLNKTTTMAYDALGRMKQRVEPDLNSQWSYDKRFDASACGKGIGKLCEAKSANGYNRKLSYDSLGRLSSTAVVLDNAASPATLSQTYDLAGRISTKTWPTGYQATYVYTPLGYLQSVSGGGTNGFEQTTSYQVLAMDVFGHVTQYKLGGNVTTVKSFDPATLRLMGQTATTDGQGSGNVLNQSYGYDALGNLSSRRDDTAGVGTQEAFWHDDLNRLTLATMMAGAASLPTTEVLYDARGNIAYKSDVGRYWYDPARPNRMTNVTLEMAPGASTALTGTRALSYVFDDYNTGVQSLNGTTVGNGNLSYTVTHDATNRRHFVRSESYTSFNMPSSIKYSNFVANKTGCQPGYTLTAGMCKLVTSSTIPATATDSGWACAAGQQLISRYCVVTTTLSVAPGATNAADRTLSFIYGPEHQRIREAVTLSGNGTSSYFAGNTWYLNGDDGLDLAYEKEVRANGTTENRHFLTANGEAFALFTSRTGTLNSLPATSTSYFQHDHLGSIAAITDANGAVTERLAYDPWGKRRNITTLAGTPDKLDALYGKNTDRGYTEQEHLDEIGVIHMNGRVYDPLMGRFMSADPHVTNPYDLRSFNRYSYVYNNPLKFVDPTGFDAWGSDHSGGDGGDGGEGGGGGFNVDVERNATLARAQQLADRSVESSREGFVVHVWGTCCDAKPVTNDMGNVDPNFSLGGVSEGTGTSLPGGSNSGRGGGGGVGSRALSIAASMTPGVSIATSAYEVAYGQDYFTGESVGLGWSVAGLALATIDLKGPLVLGRAANVSIKAGAAGGETAGKAFSQAIKDAANAENSLKVCVYCGREGVATQVDHAIPKARGGDSTLENAQLACPHCNASKGARDFPVNPPPDYFGKWPPSHWGE